MFYKRNTTTNPTKNRLYLIEFIIEDAYVIKCGKSSGKNSDARFLSILEDYIKHYHSAPYMKILRDVECEDVFTREASFHTINSKTRFYPTHPFSGYTELFSLTKEEALLSFDKIISDSINRSYTKTCYTCNIEKSTIAFHTNRAKKDGLNHSCKDCVNELMRSKNKLFQRIYSNQVSHSKTRGHSRPAYTSKDLKEWLDQQALFTVLYNNYKDNGYLKGLVPSVDRKDPKQPYTIANIQLMTFDENMKRNGRDVAEKIGKHTIVADATTGVVLFESMSVMAASAATTKNVKNVAARVSRITPKTGKLKRAGNFVYVFKCDENKFFNNGVLYEKYRRY